MKKFKQEQQELSNNNPQEDLDNDQLSTYSTSHQQSTKQTKISRIQKFQIFNPQHQNQSILSLIKLDGNIKYNIVHQINHKIISKKNKQLLNSDPNQCPICKKIFQSPQAVGGHSSRIHPKESQKYQSKVAKREERKYQLLRTRQLQGIIQNDLEFL